MNVNCGQWLLVSFILGLITNQVKSDEYTQECYKCNIEDDLCVDPFKVKLMKTCRTSSVGNYNKRGGCIKVKVNGKSGIFRSRGRAVIRDCVDDIDTACFNYEQRVRELTPENIQVECTTCKHSLCNAAVKFMQFPLWSLGGVIFYHISTTLKVFHI